MKSSRSLLALCAAAVFFCGEMEHAWAQEAARPTAAAEDVVPLEKVAEHYTQIEDDLWKKLEAIRAVVDAEAAVKRITEPVAKSLRWSLRASAATSGDIRSLLNSAHIPPDNAALTQSFSELETAVTFFQTQRDALHLGIARGLRRRVSEAVRGTPKPQDIVALMDRIEQVQNAMGRKISGAGESEIHWQSAIHTLQTLRRLIEVESAQDTTALPQAISNFRDACASQNSRDLLGDSDGRARISRILQPIAKATEEKEAALDAALEARKPSAELAAALTTFAEAADRQNPLRGDFEQAPEFGRSVIPDSVTYIYRTLISAITAMEAGVIVPDQERLHDLPDHIRHLDTKHATKFDRMLGRLNKELEEKAAQIHLQRIADLRSRLPAVKKSDELAAIAADLQTWAGQARSRGGDEPEDFNQLAQQLNLLTAAWGSASPATLLQLEQIGGAGAIRATFANEVAAVRSRVERDVLARALKAPELNSPPLANQAPAAAVETFCDDLARRGEWRRLLQILQMRPPPQVQPYGREESETVSALRSFFAGQNLELAEQWVDAAQAYKAVLRSTGERIPTKPAAERLKALTKEHPEAVAAPQEPAPHPPSRQNR